MIGVQNDGMNPTPFSKTDFRVDSRDSHMARTRRTAAFRALGIGTLLSSTLLANLPELGMVNRKKIRSP
jgi:hypothetical protein